MSTTSSNIIVGAASLAIGSIATGAAPTTGYTDSIWNNIKASASGSPKDYRGWIAGLAGTAGGGTTVNVSGGTLKFRDAGLTQEGVEVTYSPEYGEVEVDQILDAAKLFKQKMTVTVKTTFAEPTLDNLLYVWDLAASNYTPTNYDGSATQAGLIMNPGTLGDSPQERVLFFVGGKPSGTSGTANQRAYLASRAISVESSTQGLKRTEATVFPVSFRLLPDLGASTQQYGRVVDVA